MVTVRDLDKMMSLLRRVYDVDRHRHAGRRSTTSTSRSSTPSDTILEIVTYDSTTIHNTMVMADAFRMIGYPPTKVRYLVNRADSTGGIDPETWRGRSAGCRSTASVATACSSSGRTTRASRSCSPTRTRRSARTSAADRRRAARARVPGRAAARR